MKAAIVVEAGKTPVYGDFREPVAQTGERRIAVAAAALSPLARGRAAGAHYSSPAAYPFIAGVDGVGRLEDGRRVYFILPRPPFGAMAETVVAPLSQCAPAPDGLDDVTAAAIANPGMSSWAALKERARLKAGETVLVNGATGTAGRLAVQIAKHLGAGKVIATGRNPDALKSLTRLGADETIRLTDDQNALDASFRRQFASGVDVVVDYLWGRSAEMLLRTAANAGRGAIPTRFVQVGSVSGPDIALPSAVLRASAIELMGSGLGSVANDRLVAAIGELLQAAAAGAVTIAAKPAPLSQVERVWIEKADDARIVFTVGARAGEQEK